MSMFATSWIKDVEGEESYHYYSSMPFEFDNSTYHICVVHFYKYSFARFWILAFC